MKAVPIDIGYNPENECSPDLKANAGLPEIERGFIKDDRGIDEPTEFERKNRWGEPVRPHGTMPEREEY